MLKDGHAAARLPVQDMDTAGSDGSLTQMARDVDDIEATVADLGMAQPIG